MWDHDVLVASEDISKNPSLAFYENGNIKQALCYDYKEIFNESRKL